MTTDTLTGERAPAPPPIEGLVLRPYAGEVDLPELVRVQNAAWAADGQPDRQTVEELAAWFGHPSEQFQPDRDVTVAEIDGVVVAYARREWVDTNDGLREHRSGGAVDPAWRRRGIGRAVLRDSERRGRLLATTQPTERPLVHGMWASDRNLGGVALARREGYVPVRWFFDMKRPGLGDHLPDVTPLPAGVELRPVEERHLLAIWRADVEAFRDHWGGGDDSDEAFLRYRDSPQFDPRLWVVAWDGDEVAGAVINTIYPEENEASGERRGWLDSVFTRRAWRRQGLASALIGRSLHLLAERGVEVAMLGVDADNPSGALRLYESFGFRTNERATAFRKPMEMAT